MTAKDFDMLADNRLHWPPALEDIIKDGYPQAQVQVLLSHNRQSVLASSTACQCSAPDCVCLKI